MDLDEVAGRPELARELPRETLTRVLIACALALMDVHPTASMDDRAVDVHEAAGLLGMSSASLYKAAHTRLRELRIDNGSRSLKFSCVRIQDYLRRNHRQDAGSVAPLASGRHGVTRVRALTEPSAVSPLRAPTGERR